MLDHYTTYMSYAGCLPTQSTPPERPPTIVDMAACSSVFLFTLVALVLKESAAVVNSSNDSALLLPTETYRPVDMSSADWAKRIWQVQLPPDRQRTP